MELQNCPKNQNQPSSFPPSFLFFLILFGLLFLPSLLFPSPLFLSSFLKVSLSVCFAAATGVSWGLFYVIFKFEYLLVSGARLSIVRSLGTLCTLEIFVLVWMTYNYERDIFALLTNLGLHINSSHYLQFLPALKEEFFLRRVRPLSFNLQASPFSSTWGK